MVIVDLLAYVAEFAGIVLGASLLGIEPPVAVLAALAFHTVVVLSGSYRRFEIVTVVLSLALFSFVALRSPPGLTSVMCSAGSRRCSRSTSRDTSTSSSPRSVR